MTIRIVNWASMSDAEQDTCLARPAVDGDARLRTAVSIIVDSVRQDGDDAVRDLTRKLDGVELAEFRVAPDQFDDAERALSADQLAAIDVAIRNVRCFHEAQLPAPVAVDTMPGVRCERISQPLDSVGLYVPAGTAPLPSAAIMLGVPATIAGCLGSDRTRSRGRRCAAGGACDDLPIRGRDTILIQGGRMRLRDDHALTCARHGDQNLRLLQRFRPLRKMRGKRGPCPQTTLAKTRTYR